MNFLSNGKVSFSDIYEVFYHMFTEIGLSINSNQYLYDQDSGIPIKCKDKYIKATTQPVTLYAGRNDIVFDPARNYYLMIYLLGYYLDKESDRINFTAQFTDYDDTREKQRVIVKTSNGDIASNYYYNIYLGYIEMIFLLGENFIPDLSNFDCCGEFQ